MYPVFWAAEQAPVYDAEERAILIGLVIKGDFDGMNCFRSYATLAKVARVDPKTVGRKCRAMETRGILSRQTEHVSPVWHKIPEAQRPIVWEAMIPAEWWSAQQLAEINEQREKLGRELITAQNRPPIADPPPKKQRVDKGAKRPANDVETDGAGTSSPHPTDSQSPCDPGTSSPTTFSVTSSVTPSVTTVTPPPSNDALFDVADQDVPTADAVGGEQQQSAQKVSAQTIVGEWLERCPKRPPQRITGQVAKTVKELLDEQIEADDVRRGMAAWMNSGKTAPSLIPGFVHEVMNGLAAVSAVPGPGGVLVPGGRVVPFARPSTTDQRVNEALAAGRRLQALADQRREQEGQP